MNKITKKETIFVGVSWPYANGKLHIGHLAGQNVVCDVFARYHRQKGNKVLMVSGTDAHGTPILVKAKKEGITPKQTSEKYYRSQLKTFEKLNCDWDIFTTTGSENHQIVAQNIFKTLYELGFIYDKEVEQYFDPKAKQYLADRYIEGTCPYCGFENARGDQCNGGCERILDPTELINPRSTLSDATPILKKHTILYFDLPRFEPDIKKLTKKNKDVWRKRVTGFTNAWLKDGLRERPVSRKLGYGIPVPIEEFKDHDIYVWYEAVMGYLSAAIEWAHKSGNPSAWEDFWKDPKAKHYYFIAKDNIPFHTILWPATIIAYNHKYQKGKYEPALPGEKTARPLQLAYDVPANQFLTLRDQRLSKSTGHLIDADELLNKYNPDLIRYFFTKYAPENHDRDFTWHTFVDANNTELVANFGNFVNRTLTFVEAKLGGKLSGKLSISPVVQKKIDIALKDIGQYFEDCQFNKACSGFMELSRYGNKYFNDNEPWVTVNSDISACEQTLYDCTQLVYALGIACRPIMPATSDKILSFLGQKKKNVAWKFTELKKVQISSKISLLFDKLEKPEDTSSTGDNIIIGKIETLEVHPNSNDLQIAQVLIGDGKPLTLICGAKNIRVGHLVPIALPGSKVKSQKGKLKKIKKSTIHGIVSEGMLCSPYELDLSDDNVNICILPKGFEKRIGKPFTEFKQELFQKT
ncbi:MAG: class I tRNA ligase family protein [Patescibacteria group bacterium]|nr:class I tRNA ligase family protein [Patescibacteria group bacterium]